MRPFERFYARFLIAALALAVAGLGLAGCVGPGATMRHAMSADAFAGSQRNMHGRMAKLVGAWQVETTAVNQGTTFPALLTFTSDGIVLADEPPSPFETTGHGAWAATGPDTADFTFVSLVGSEEGPLSATIKVVGSLQYDAGADTFNGPFKVRVVDASGTELLADDGTFDATRIAVESLDSVADTPEAGGTLPAPAAAAGLQPGDTVGGMVVAQGPVPFDPNLPPSVAFCNPNPQVPLGATVAEPGEYTVQCTVPPLPKMFIGFGVAGRTKEEMEQVWDVTPADIYVNDQLIDQQAFGMLDTEISVGGMPGEDAAEVVNLQLRVWNVVLENLTPGEFTMRQRIASTAEVFDGDITWPQGVYDITYVITVDESMAAGEGEPEPVDMYQQPENVFDAFNAAVNAHDMDAALALFADDAVAQFPNQPPPNLYTGKDEIRAWLEDDFSNNIRVETADVQTAGDTVTGISNVQVDSLPPDFVLRGTVEITVNDGKITSFNYTLDDDTIERLEALGAGPVEYVRKIDTSAQQIRIPVSLAVDGQGSVYVTDGSDTPRVLKYDSEGNFVQEWGEQGGGEGQFQFSPPTPDAGPIGGFVATDGQANVYVSDAFNARVQKFDADGNFLMQFGEMGSGEGQFDPPGAGPVYVDGAGNIYVSTFPRVQKFDADGNFLASFGKEGAGDGEFTGAALGTIDDDGNMYVADLLNARVQKLDADGNFVLTWGSAGTAPGQFYLPVAIVQDSAGRIYVADNTGRIQVFDSEGNYLDEWSETGEGNPPLEGEISGLAIDTQDNIYVANFATPSIYVFRPR